MPGYFANNIVMTCHSITFANSGIDGGGMTRASITLAASNDLNPTNVGDPLYYLEDGLSFAGRTLRIGDTILVNHNTCSNYPSELPDFLGYISSINPVTQDMNSVVNIELRDERWKWSQIFLPVLTINQGQKPLSNKDGRPDTYGSAKDKEMTVWEIIDFVTRIVRNFHPNFSFYVNTLPDRQIGEITTGGNAYTFLLGLITRYYGTKYQFYSNGAGHLEIIEVETNRSKLRQFKVDTHNLIVNNMSLASSPEEDVDMIFCVGANKQYYVGDGEYDNELVPDWDWWNDGRILVIDKKTYTPALYQDSSGKYQLVNPFDFGINLSNPDNPIFLGPGAMPSQSNKIIVFREFFEQYPTFQEYNQRLNKPENSYTGSIEMGGIFITKFAYGTTFAMDCLLRPTAINEPLHNGRFRRFRLKDSTPRHFVYQDADGMFRHGVYYDRRSGSNHDFTGFDSGYGFWIDVRDGKKFPGDPADLNFRVLSGMDDVQDPILFDRYMVQNKDAYCGYKVIILDQFLNNASYEIKMMRQKPGTFLTGIDSPNDLTEKFLPIPDEEDPTELKEGPSLGPIVVRYDLVAGKKVFGHSHSFAEKVRVNNFRIVNGNRILFDEPQIFMSDQIDEKFMRSLYQSQLNGMVEGHYDENIYDDNGLDTGKDWYYPFSIGKDRARVGLVPKVDYPVKSIDIITKDGVREEETKYEMAKTSYPLAIPRIEIYCFVQYVDFPEREKNELLGNILTSAYWRDIKTLYQYPENVQSLSGKKIMFDYRDDIVHQVGGMFDYTGDRQLDVNKYEIIAFYDNANFNIAEDFDTGDQNLLGYGQKKTIIAFQLRNDKYKFMRDVYTRVNNFVPKGYAQYYNRCIMPEKNNTNVFISSVTHNLGDRWTVDVSYGGSMPNVRRLFDDTQKLEARIYTIMEDTKNKNVTAFQIIPSQGLRTP